MVPERQDPLDELAGRVADGEKVDWEALDERTKTAAVEALRFLDEMRDEIAYEAAAILEETPPLEKGYEILEELGRGSYGRVYRAMDRALGREVALKVQDESVAMSPGDWERFVSEARTLASLDQKNIVRIYSIEEEEGRLQLSLELVDGRTLADIVAERGALSATEAARVGVELCRALAAIHGRDIVHQDLKPANVMRARGGRIVLLDFGFAHVVGDGDGISRGTPRTMSPEQFEADGRVGPASDLYALGVLLYWLATGGRYPHEAETVGELGKAVIEGRTTPLRDLCPDVPDAFLDIVGRAMSIAPEDRYSSAGSMEQALRTFLAQASGPLSASASGSRIVEASAPRSTATTLVGLLAVVLLATAIALVVREVPTDAQAQGAAAAAGPGIRFVQAFYAVDARGQSRRLAPGSPVVLDEQLYFAIQPVDEDVHVYIFNQDGQKVVTLFPLEGWEPQNPLVAGEEHKLPGTRKGKRENWVINSRTTGEEEFLVVVSRGPDPWAERVVSDVPQAGDAMAMYGASRGVEKTAKARDTAGSTPVSLRDLYEAAERAGDGGRFAYVNLVNLGRASAPSDDAH